MGHIGIKENAYSNETPNTLSSHKAHVDSALASRRDAYSKELARQVHNDHLCKEFADLVNSFSHWLSHEKDAVSRSSAPKDEQLAKIQGLLSDKHTQSAKLDPIRAAEAKVEEAGIEQNRHTSLTSKDVEIQYDGFYLLLSRKAEMLKELIELEKLKGVTAEEWEEFNNNFGKFDKDHDDKLESKEFKALMYSVGEELSKAAAAELFATYAQNDRISRPSYLEYMVRLAGDSDTRDNVKDGFQLLSNGKAMCARAELERVVNADAVAFIYTTMPHEGDAGQYSAWIEEVFSR